MGHHPAPRQPSAPAAQDAAQTKLRTMNFLSILLLAGTQFSCGVANPDTKAELLPMVTYIVIRCSRM